MQAQRTLGIYQSEQAARAAAQGLGMVVQGLAGAASLALGIFGVSYLAKNCAGEGSSSNSEAPTTSATSTSTTTSAAPSTTSVVATSTTTSAVATTTSAAPTTTSAAVTTAPADAVKWAEEVAGGHVLTRGVGTGTDSLVKIVVADDVSNVEQCAVTGEISDARLNEEAGRTYLSGRLTGGAGAVSTVDITCDRETLHLDIEHVVVGSYYDAFSSTASLDPSTKKPVAGVFDFAEGYKGVVAVDTGAPTLTTMVEELAIGQLTFDGTTGEIFFKGPRGNFLRVGLDDVFFVEGPFTYTEFYDDGTQVSVEGTLDFGK